MDAATPRDWMADVLAGFCARKIFTPGDSIEARGQRGILKAITATQTLAERESGPTAFVNSALLDEIVRR